ncbi:MAG TPA: hypothetical protein VI583_06510 [Cyclobacteriaceae bacterium]|nr:hypothetical protein [Cyclobacteriaceae bacterium]
MVIINRYRPSWVILFNEIGSLFNQLIRNENIKKISWFLEYPESYTKSFGEKLIQQFSFIASGKANCLIFPTQVRKAMAFVRQPSLMSRKSYVIHNVPCLAEEVSRNKTAYSGSYGEAMSFLKEDPGAIHIIYAGAVGNRYGWDSLIKAICLIQKNIRLLILGVKHPQGLREFNHAILNCGKTSYIKWLDPVPYNELESLLQLADMGYVIYRGDNLNTYFSAPGKLYEYLKSGLVLLTDTDCCIADDLTWKKAGVFIRRPFDYTGILTALSEIEKDDLNVMKLNSRELFETKYNMEIQSARLVQWMKEYDT